MRTLTIQCLAVAAALVPPAAAQGFLHMPASRTPALNELGTYTDVPMMRASARVQQFFDATEAGASTFVVTGVDLRYDGPIPMVGAPGPFTIQRMQISVGTSTVGTPGPVFAANVQAPLTVVFDGPVTYWPDQGSQTPAPWGGLNGGLSLPFNFPMPISIPPGGWFVIEIAVSGNNLNSQAHALLDAESGPGGPFNGSASSSGIGCPPTAFSPPATISTAGVHAPGAVHRIQGQNLGANAPVIVVLGASDTQAAFGPLPFGLPATSCSIYTSWDVLLTTVADPIGRTRPNDPALRIALSAEPAISFVTYYAQLVSLVAGANPPWNLVLSDKRTVQLGGLNANALGMYVVANGSSDTDPVADSWGEFGYAMRIRTP